MPVKHKMDTNTPTLSTAGDAENPDKPRIDPRKKTLQAIARCLEAEIKLVTDSSLGWWPAEILHIEFDSEGLLLSTRLPFPIFEPSGGEGEWPESRREQERCRTKYAEYLFKQEKKLASFFFQRLVDFLIEDRDFNRFGPEVMKRLKTIAQREFAGHPAETIHPAMERKIRRKGLVICRTVESMREDVKSWQKKNASLRDADILRRLRRKFTQNKIPWIKHFYSMSESLPRRRYWSATLDEMQVLESAPADGRPSPCKLSEPDQWSVADIVARVVQIQLRNETGKMFALLRIKNLIRSKKPASSIAAK